MRLLRLIGLPYARKHLLRSILTTAGIVLGVALLVGMRTADESVLRAFNQTVDRIAGKTQLQVSAGDSGFGEDVLDRVEAVAEVRAAAPVIEASVDTGLPGQGKLLILAVDMTGDRSLRDYDFDSGDNEVIDDPLVFLAQPDSLIVTREFAGRNGLRTGAKLAFNTMEGPRQFTVRGILKAGGMAAAFGGNLGIMDIYAAQKVFGRGQRFDRIDVGLGEGVPLDKGEAALERALGPGFRVEPPSSRGREFESLVGIYTLAMGISSAFALFIGMFIIYNSFAIAVTERRAEIGILRALGATRGQIRGLFLAESGIAGLVGSLAGVGVGLAFAHSLTGMTGQLMESMLGVPQNAQAVTLDPWWLAMAVALGVAVSMAAAFIPARNAARLEPVQALQKGKYQVMGAGENRVRRRAAVVAAVCAAACLAGSANRGVFYAGFLLTVVAFLLLAPFLAVELARLLRRPMKWLRPVEGALAADSLIQAPRRTSATVAALMLSLALVIAQGGMARASYASVEQWLTASLNPDLFVTASETIAARDFHFPASMRGEIEALPGVEEVQPVRTARVQFRGKPVMIIAIELQQMARRVHRIVVAGDPNEMNRMAGEEKGVIVSETLANMNKLRLGDMIEIPTPTKPLHLPVVGVVREYSNQLGSIFLERKTYVRYFEDDTVDIYRVYLKRGASAMNVRAAIVERLGKQRRLFVLLNREVRDYVLKLTNQWLGMTYLQVIVAVMVAVLGIVNTLTVSIADRRRELGVLRAVGGLRAQIRGAVWLEAAAIGLIGLTLGIGIGAIMLYYELQAIRRDFNGMALDYVFPWGIVAMLVPVILAAALGAAILPAERAVRGSLVEALEYE
jgi:putative ABC transport system permease protein